MADAQRSGAAARGNGNRSSSNGVRRTSQSRRLATRPGAIPRWAYIVIIVVPLTGIVTLLALKASRNPDGPKTEKVDTNARIKELIGQIPALEKDVREAAALLQKEDTRGKSKAEAVEARLDKWIEEWDSYFDSQRDEDDKLPEELQGYMQYRREVSILIQDMSKVTGF